MDSTENKFKFRAVIPIVRSAGLGYATLIYLLIYLIASLVVFVCEPNVSFSDAAWACFEALSTIGFGDVPTTMVGSRVAIVVLSLVSIVYLAVLTGVIVSCCTEMMKQRTDESIAQYLSDLENLDKLSPQELKELSAKIKHGTKS